MRSLGFIRQGNLSYAPKTRRVEPNSHDVELGSTRAPSDSNTVSNEIISTRVINIPCVLLLFGSLIVICSCVAILVVVFEI